MRSVIFEAIIGIAVMVTASGQAVPPLPTRDQPESARGVHS